MPVAAVLASSAGMVAAVFLRISLRLLLSSHIAVAFSADHFIWIMFL